MSWTISLSQRPMHPKVVRVWNLEGPFLDTVYADGDRPLWHVRKTAVDGTSKVRTQRWETDLQCKERRRERQGNSSLPRLNTYRHGSNIHLLCPREQTPLLLISALTGLNFGSTFACREGLSSPMIESSKRFRSLRSESMFGISASDSLRRNAASFKLYAGSPARALVSCQTMNSTVDSIGICSNNHS